MKFDYIKLEARSVLEFWYSNESKWYAKDRAFDEDIKNSFNALHKKACAGELEDWKPQPFELLALIIILDQFSRNMFRDTPNMYASDELALEYAKYAIHHGYDEIVQENIYKQFFYMPFMHSENLEEQELCVELFTKLQVSNSINYARQHRDIILKYGRFPHRNAILGRSSTAEELEFLTQPGSSF